MSLSYSNLTAAYWSPRVVSLAWPSQRPVTAYNGTRPAAPLPPAAILSPVAARAAASPRSIEATCPPTSSPAPPALLDAPARPETPTALHPHAAPYSNDGGSSSNSRSSSSDGTSVFVIAAAPLRATTGHQARLHGSNSTDGLRLEGAHSQVETAERLGPNEADPDAAVRAAASLSTCPSLEVVQTATQCAQLQTATVQTRCFGCMSARQGRQPQLQPLAMQQPPSQQQPQPLPHQWRRPQLRIDLEATKVAAAAAPPILMLATVRHPEPESSSSSAVPAAAGPVRRPIPTHGSLKAPSGLRCRASVEKRDDAAAAASGIGSPAVEEAGCRLSPSPSTAVLSPELQTSGLKQLSSGAEASWKKAGVWRGTYLGVREAAELENVEL